MVRRFSTSLPVVFGCAVLPPAERFGSPPYRLSLGSVKPSQMLPIGGVQVAVYDGDPSASKPAMVCLHAVWHGSSDFAALEQYFAQRFRVILIDWPSHGASSKDTIAASAERYEFVLTAVVERLGIKSLMLVGNSIGGAAATRYAAAHPGRVRGLVLSNPGGFDEGGLLARLFIGHLKSRFEWGVLGQARFQPWFQSYYHQILVTAESAEQRRKIIRSGFEMAETLYQASDSFAQPSAYLGSLVPKLTMPVFVAWADRDQLVQWDRNRKTIGKIPKLRVRHFEAGHSPFLETSAAFNTALDEFLRSLD
jgi:pimeloyl-ACP methyl ester carboxylesterase